MLINFFSFFLQVEQEVDIISPRHFFSIKSSVFVCGPTYMQNCSVVEESNSQPIYKATTPLPSNPQVFAAHLVSPCRTLVPAAQFENRYFRFIIFI